MSETLAYGAAGIGLLICLVLAVYATKLLWDLHKQKQQRQADALKQEEKRQKTRTYVLDSLIIISQAIEAKQIDLGEASIRVATLMEFLPETELDRKPYQVFFHLRAALAHIPQKQAFSDLPSEQRHAFRQQIQEQEEKFHDFIMAANQQLKSSLQALQP